MTRRSISALGALVLLALPAAADVAASNAAPFVGEWQIAFPDGEDVIVNVPSVSCDDPARIAAVGETSIHVTTPRSDIGIWEVKSFGGRFPWWQENSESLLAEWISEDAFLLAGRDRTGIKADWDNAKQWTRCPVD
jgi:hypothetical protein